MARQVYVQTRFLSAIVSLTFKAAVRAAHLPREVPLAFASRMTPADSAPVAPAGESGSFCRGPEASLVRQSGGGVNSSTDSKI